MYKIKFKDGSEKEFDTLVGADLSFADLSSANLSSADLSFADLSSADLSSADLSSADLSSANFRYANLRYANFRSANLRYANLSYADLRYANLRSADLSNCKGVLYFGLEKHFAIYFKYCKRYYLNIGCQCKTIEEWLETFKDVGNRQSYSNSEIEIYGSFIKLCSQYEIVSQ